MAEKVYIEREALEHCIREENHNLAGLIQHIREHCPTADVVEVMHGEWIETIVDVEHPNGYYQEEIYICPYCGRTEKEKEPYCNCGAKMDGGNN